MAENFSLYEEFDADSLGSDSSAQLFRALIATLVVSTALLGIVTNTFIFVVSLVHIRGDYRHFIANLAVVDIACALLYAFMGYIYLADPDQIPNSVMFYSAFAFYGSFGVLICALVPVSLSRIVAAWHPKTYDQLFSGKRALAVCAAADLIPMLLLAVIAVARHAVAKWLFAAFATLTVAAHFVTFVSNTLVFRLVARHISVVECLHDRNRLLETRQVAVATLAQAIVPLVCQVPAFLTLSSALLLIEPLTNGNVIVITQLWLAASPLFDALITLFVIKQYRVQTAAFCAAMLRRDYGGARLAIRKAATTGAVERHQLTSFYSAIPKIRVASG